jgi:hypothetical protein
MNRAEWIRANLEYDDARAALVELAEAAHAFHDRTGVRIADYTFDELGKLTVAERARPIGQRKRFYLSGLDPGDASLDYIVRYLDGCDSFAEHYGRGLVEAADVHARAVTGMWPDAVLARVPGRG